MTTHPYTPHRLVVLLLCLLTLLALSPPVPASAAEVRGKLPGPGHEVRITPVVRAVQTVSPAVVNITTATRVQSRGGRMDDLFSPLFQEFFNLPVPQLREREYLSLGSGVIIDGKRALVLTNAHVIAGAGSIKARLSDGREFTAELVGAGPDFDLAVLQLKEAKDLPEAEMGDSGDLFIGETVIAIGNSYGFNHTVTTGVISALNRSVKTEQAVFSDFIQTDAAINPGNSGGPLVNLLGQVIGINTAIHAQAEGIGFAIPVNKAKRVVAQLLDKGSVSPVWLGLIGQDLDQRLAGYFGLDRLQGMLITEIYPETPAAAAGLQTGDLLLSINGVPIEDKTHYLHLLRNYVQGQPLRLTLLRREGQAVVEVKAGDFSAETALSLASGRWGFVPGNNALRRGGLLVDRVVTGSPAHNLGLEPGDVLLAIHDIRMRQPEDFILAVQLYRMNNSLLMLVARGGRTYHVRLDI